MSIYTDKVCTLFSYRILEGVALALAAFSQTEPAYNACMQARIYAVLKGGLSEGYKCFEWKTVGNTACSMQWAIIFDVIYYIDKI